MDQITSRKRFPLVPEDLEREPSLAIVRAAAAHIRAGPNRRSVDLADEIDDEPAQIILRSDTAPAKLSTTGWAKELAARGLADFVVGLAPLSAGAALIAGALQVPLNSWAGVVIPGYLVNANDAGGFVGEGEPIPVRSLNIYPSVLLAPSKIGVITPYSRELAEYSNFETIVKQILGESTGLALDAAIFSTAAADATRPAGLLFNNVPITATGNGGVAALATDVENLLDALSTAGGGRDVVFIAPLAQAGALKAWAGPKFDYPILTSAALTKGTVLAIERSAFVSTFMPIPQFSVTKVGVLHMSTAPTEIVSGTGPTTADPARALYQTDTLALRTILRCSFGMRGSGLVQQIQNVTW